MMTLTMFQVHHFLSHKLNVLLFNASCCSIKKYVLLTLFVIIIANDYKKMNMI